ncbi:MAG TPA: AtpZ/AtpI family protein [Terriglobales bacterium]|nr:AtpZ/AtpI family protein [Terriglobales bacterium]
MPRDPQSSGKNENFWVQVARYSQVAFMLPAGSAVGWLVGTALDHWLHKTWINIAGLILGTIAGFVELIRMVIASSDSDTNSD